MTATFHIFFYIIRVQCNVWFPYEIQMLISKRQTFPYKIQISRISFYQLYVWLPYNTHADVDIERTAAWFLISL